MIKGIDVSHYQNEAGKIDWARVKAAKYDFAYIKATEATSYKDPYYQVNIDGASKAGLVVGSYHFARGNDPVKEADHFISTVGKMQKGDFLVLDWEIENADPDGWCRKFLDRCFEKTGVRPLLYTNQDRVNRINWAQVVRGNYGLISARYGDNDAVLEPGEEASADEFPAVAIQQFSSTGSVPGISGRVDLNASDMTVEQLKKYGYQGAPAPTPTPPAENQCRVLPELAKALKFAHDIDIYEYIDDKDQLLMAERLTALKKSEVAALEKLDKIKKII